MKRLAVFALLLSSPACGGAKPAPPPAAAAVPAPVAPLPVASPTAPAALVEVEGSLPEGRYAISLPAGFKKHANDKPDSARYSAATDPDEVEYFVDVSFAAMPASLEDAVELTNIFPKDSLVRRKEPLAGGGYLVSIVDKDGTGVDADTWVPHLVDAKLALTCTATSFEKGNDPARQAEVEQICRSLKAR